MRTAQLIVLKSAAETPLARRHALQARSSDARSASAAQPDHHGGPTGARRCDCVSTPSKASELVEMASELVKTRLIHAQALGAVYRSQLEGGLKTVTSAHCMSVI